MRPDASGEYADVRQAHTAGGASGQADHSPADTLARRAVQNKSRLRDFLYLASMAYLFVAFVVDVDLSPFLAKNAWKLEYKGSFGCRKKGSKSALAAVFFGTSMTFSKRPTRHEERRPACIREAGSCNGVLSLRLAIAMPSSNTSLQAGALPNSFIITSTHDSCILLPLAFALSVQWSIQAWGFLIKLP